MPAPYKESHDKLLAAIGTADQFSADWQEIAAGMAKVVIATGFDARHQKTCDEIRTRLGKSLNEASAIRIAANTSALAVGTDAVAGNGRALAVKTLRHLYLHQSFGKQKIWILSLPEKIRAFPMAFATNPPGIVDKVLATTGERFDPAVQRLMSSACQQGLSWVQKAMIVAGAPLELAHRKLFRRWFVPAGVSGEDSKITAWATSMLPQLQKIASGLKSGEVVLTDAPQERKTGSDLERSEAFVFTNNDVIAIYVENDFFGSQNTLTGPTNWARILVHELTHAYAKTKDHAYSWQGLLPRDDDAFKPANDTYVARSPNFPAVRALTFAQCKENADSWAYFCADAAGALSESDRIRALGTRLYDLGSVIPSPAVTTRIGTQAR